MTNKLDQIYRCVRLNRYFVKGWGKPENLKRLCEFRKIVSNRELCYKLISPDYPVQIEKEQEEKDCILVNGSFTTPLYEYLPEMIPNESRTAYFQMVLPKEWLVDNFKPVIVHIAGTGDQYFWRRRNIIARPLIREANIGSIILENPFYGLRKPSEQQRSILQNVSDIFVMGGCLTLESLVLFHFCERQGYGPLGVTGLSMGGHMASIAATVWPKPLVVVPCLSGLTASHVFTQGVIRHALNWKMLEKQYISNECFRNEVQKMLSVIEGDAFKAGQQFAKKIAQNETSEEEQVCIYPIKMPEIDYDRMMNILEPTKVDEKSDSFSVTFPSQEHPVNSDVQENNNNCDNSAHLMNNSTILHNVTANACSNFDVKLALNVDNSKTEVARMQNENNSTRLDSISTFLNKIVDLTRSSVNVNILASKTRESFDVKKNDTRIEEREAFNFMNGIMDELTHVKNYSVPVDTSLAIAVCADDDAYVPKKGISNLSEIWPEAEVRHVKGGHVWAYVQYQKEFRLAIVDAFNRYRTKYIDKRKN